MHPSLHPPQAFTAEASFTIDRSSVPPLCADAPMLAAVGTGICINLDRRLRGLARLRGWEVRRFRLHAPELGHPDRLAAAGVTVA